MSYCYSCCCCWLLVALALTSTISNMLPFTMSRTTTHEQMHTAHQGAPAEYKGARLCRAGSAAGCSICADLQTSRPHSLSLDQLQGTQGLKLVTKNKHIAKKKIGLHHNCQLPQLSTTPTVLILPQAVTTTTKTKSTHSGFSLCFCMHNMLLLLYLRQDNTT